MMETKSLVLAGLMVLMVFAAIVYAASMAPKPVEGNDLGGTCGVEAGGCFADGSPVNAAAAQATYAPSAGSEREQELQGDVQTVQMSFDWSTEEYNPREIRVKAGDTVRIEADTSTFSGCMSTLVVNGLGISKRMRPGDNVLEFVADTPGQYQLSCTMGMGYGLLIVEDENGDVPAGVAAAPASSGGCGCGG